MEKQRDIWAVCLEAKGEWKLWAVTLPAYNKPLFNPFVFYCILLIHKVSFFRYAITRKIKLAVKQCVSSNQQSTSFFFFFFLPLSDLLHFGYEFGIWPTVLTNIRWWYITAVWWVLAYDHLKCGGNRVSKLMFGAVTGRSYAFLRLYLFTFVWLGTPQLDNAL